MYDYGINEEAAVEMVGPGWRSLVEKLYANKPSSVTVVQVKEKFGGLRFYVEPDNYESEAFKEFDQLIRQVEAESYKTCERCGNPGKADNYNYWIHTLCDLHRKERRNKG